MGKVIEATTRFLRIKPDTSSDPITLTNEITQQEMEQIQKHQNIAKKQKYKEDENFQRMIDRAIQKTWDNP